MIVPVRISNLQLTDFRNHAESNLAMAEALSVLLGPNGAGKTNILEAISFLSPGRGMRRAPYASIARLGGPGGWSIFANISQQDIQNGIGSGLVPNETSRRVRINGADAPNAEALLEHAQILWLTPANDGLFTGSASDRRRFLDRMVLAIDSSHGRRVADFERIMRGRNRLLDEGASDDYLDAVEMQMAELGIAISLARTNLVGRLAGYIDQGDPTSPFPRPHIGLAGEFESEICQGASVDAEDFYREQLGRMRGRDRAAKRTLDGPHRSDFAVTHSAKEMPAALSSTGEQKGLLISIFLAHTALATDLNSATPILLLDEIAAHLDEIRRDALFNSLRELNVQALMTGTDRQDFDSIKANAEFFAVEAGEIHAFNEAM